MSGVFVTGTDTGVGKTLASCALLHALRARGVKVAPMKPIAAGASAQGDQWRNEDTAALLAAAGWDDDRAGIVTPVLLRDALAPHIAAQREGRGITLDPVLDAFAQLQVEGFTVVEGVGGFRVPLAPGLDTVGLAQAIALPVVLVVGLRLGCLNHALLTAQAIAAARLAFAGWIANEIDPAMQAREENVEALRELLAAPLLGRIRHGSGPQAAADELDVSALLAPVS